MSKRTCRLAPWTVLAVELVLVAPLVAQRITGQIRGKISDPSLAGLSGVTVELTSNIIIGKRATVTTERGHYRFITLRPGFYNLLCRSAAGRMRHHGILRSLRSPGSRAGAHRVTAWRAFFSL